MSPSVIMTDMQSISMSVQNLDRHDVIRRLMRKEMKQAEAAELLGLSVRQIKRLKKRVKQDGAKGLIHGLSGKVSNRRLKEEECAEIEKIVKEKYLDFSATMIAEKLEELHGVTRDPKTIADTLVRRKVWKTGKRKKKTRTFAWRARRPSFGELEQFDGSYHPWLEDRYTDSSGSHEICLLASIDDANGSLTRAEFATGEGVVPVFAFWREYVCARGKPRGIYLDRFSTYRMNPALLVEQPELRTQFERVMKELGVSLITAHTPQAKGRVERLFQTLQDRLVKELRLANISTIEDANVFLNTRFMQKFDAKFSVTPADEKDLHIPLSKTERTSIDATFSIQHNRVIHNDLTISHNNVCYQILDTPRLNPRPKDTVLVEVRLNGTIHFRLRGKYLNTTVLPARPVPAQQNTISKPRSVTVPGSSHPWSLRIQADILQKQNV